MSTFFTAAPNTPTVRPRIHIPWTRFVGATIVLGLAGTLVTLVTLAPVHGSAPTTPNEHWSAAAVLQTEPRVFTHATWDDKVSTPIENDAAWMAEHSRPLYYLVAGADRKGELEAALIWEEQESPGLSMAPRVRVVIDAELADTATLESIPFNARVIDTRP